MTGNTAYQIFFLFSVLVYGNIISLILTEMFSSFVTRDLAEVVLEFIEPSYGKILVKEIFIDVYV